jgi:UDP-N-acetylmuramoyl-tripeptide--D-alanyl-D-alanine ligase
MIALGLAAAATLLGGRLLGADTEFRGVSTDTRTLSRGQLFVALRGPRFDAHDKLGDAAAGGAAGAVVSHVVPTALPQIVVADPRRALGELARAWRARFALPVLAVTGSAGKTTVKEMLASIMRTQGRVLATRGNLNNDIGVPLTLFELGGEHRSAVLEMGANRAGDIAWLVDIAQPSVGMVTLCAPAHLAGFGSVEGVARAKGEMFAHLPPDAIAVINAGDAYANLWRELAAPRRVVSFGATGAVRAANLSEDATGSSFDLCHADERVRVRLTQPGLHNVYNACAAAAAAIACAVPLAAIQAGLTHAPGVAGRLQSRRGHAGCVLLDDTYNANPASLAAALAVLGARPAPRWLVLGDMAELGADAVAYHREAGATADAAGVERLFTLGDLARSALDTFTRERRHCATHEEAVAAVRAELIGAALPPTILIKGSRVMALDRVADALAVRSD